MENPTLGADVPLIVHKVDRQKDMVWIEVGTYLRHMYLY